ncbi:MAG TPA: tetrahydrofolate dehydrogenase/cyclohydrolase catalytic domain-containing protein, partial [Candidatus Saccharimonadales bacterium]|nr:tetrahydrofolate dehydrogenase/cyclohydrolase catalytic domain-containing protein [Candidatus Saccharimonadales bacterium]
MARLLPGRPLAERIKADSLVRSRRLHTSGIRPRLAVVGVGGDPAANSYVQRLQRSAGDAGVEVTATILRR